MKGHIMIPLDKLNAALKAIGKKEQPKVAQKKKASAKQIKVSLVVPDRKRLAPNQKIITITRPFVAAR